MSDLGVSQKPSDGKEGSGVYLASRKMAEIQWIRLRGRESLGRSVVQSWLAVSVCYLPATCAVHVESFVGRSARCPLPDDDKRKVIAKAQAMCRTELWNPARA